MQSHILSILIFLPLVGAVLILLVPRRSEAFVRNFAFGLSLVVFALPLVLYFGFDRSAAEMQFVEQKPWISSYGISYFVGVDGISVLLVILTAFLTPLSILASFRAITERAKEFYAAMLFIEAAMIGVFCALDLFLFYVFWEAMLIPMYLLIGVWGSVNRIYAALKFFIYTMFGGVLMLVAIIFLVTMYARTTGAISFNLLDIQNTLRLPLGVQVWLFLAFGIAFAIKVPMFPFHTWLPDAHVEAPTAGSVILAGILLKMGTYGFLRFAMPLFPDAARHYTPLVMVLAIIGIIYGALVALVQPDLKKLVAYSSVSHLGFVMLGIFALNTVGIIGAMVIMISHGLSTGALFLTVGMIYERRHTRMIADFGGLWKVIPVFGTFFLIFTLASIGLPGTSGFVGEFLSVLGAFRVYIPWAVLAAIGVILSAVYMLWMFQRVMQGEADKPENRSLVDLSLREIVVLAPIAVAIFWIGIYPKPLTEIMEPSVNRVIEQVRLPERPPEPVLAEESVRYTWVGVGDGKGSIKWSMIAVWELDGVGGGDGGRWSVLGNQESQYLMSGWGGICNPAPSGKPESVTPHPWKGHSYPTLQDR